MAETFLLDRVLSLPASDVKALQEGRTIAALPIAQVQTGWNFILYPYAENEASTEVKLETWAICKSFQMIHEVEQLSTLAALTLWSHVDLKRLFAERGHLSLALLKAHRLPEPIVILREAASGIKLGKFVGLLHFDKEAFKESVSVTKILPILSETVFANRHRQIINFQPPKHPTLEALQSEVAHHAQTSLAAKALDNDLRVFLDWADPLEKIAIDQEYDWIQTIALSGNSSDGYCFEKRVRQSFIQLGFTNTLNNIRASLDPDATGGAGGIDIYCAKPFPIVGECKASKHEKVPDGVAAQLLRLGTAHLGKERFESSIKIIFAAGILTNPAENTAKEYQINVMRPETLQRLVELKVNHPGAIDLLELKPCLETAPFGTDADAKVNEFIDRIEQRIKVRSHIVSTLKTYLEIRQEAETGIDKFSGFFYGSHPPQQLGDRELYDILIELSSPLTGYLGRTKGNTWKDDRFYFLRDLMV